ncbi:surface-adhesin E family protein [Magnetospirillum gryphiswaldense]|uniref:surface-adhesin E family protein n=1 Tax=Magnetospirillum gryphiswaldense TaxID=55518 RepID=UPI00131A0DA6|nr:surface-adhesin E family protein [Magnetospirillum gryphiswaldense]
MKNVIPVAILAFLGSITTAKAEWVNIGSAFTGLPFEETDYFDPNSITRDGDILHVFHLIDYPGNPVALGLTGKSITFYAKYNCNTERKPNSKHYFKHLGLTEYSGRMGSGSIVRDRTNDDQLLSTPQVSVDDTGPFVTIARRVSSIFCR